MSFHDKIEQSNVVQHCHVTVLSNVKPQESQSIRLVTPIPLHLQSQAIMYQQFIKNMTITNLHIALFICK